MTDQIWVRYVQNLTFQVYRVKNLTFYSKVSNFTAKCHFFRSIGSKTSLLGVWGVVLGGPYPRVLGRPKDLKIGTVQAAWTYLFPIVLSLIKPDWSIALRNHANKQVHYVAQKL